MFEFKEPVHFNGGSNFYNISHKFVVTFANKTICIVSTLFLNLRLIPRGRKYILIHF